MSWSWGHSTEAYINAEENLHRRSLKTLQEIWCEWKAYRDNDEKDWWHSETRGCAISQFDLEVYTTELKALRKKCREDERRLGKNFWREALANDIWPWMEDLATCTNGGWSAWCCPFGCSGHMVSFSSQEELMAAGRQKWLAEKRKLKQNGKTN